MYDKYAFYSIEWRSIITGYKLKKYFAQSLMISAILNNDLWEDITTQEKMKLIILKKYQSISSIKINILKPLGTLEILVEVEMEKKPGA